MHSSELKHYENCVFSCLSIIFFFIIAAYTFLWDIRDSVFTYVVGREYIPLAKLFSMLLLVPAILFYSFLVDILRKQYLLSFYIFLYATLCLIFAFFLGHSTIGLYNTAASPHRIMGWLFYFFIEGFTPFIISVFWAFVNSISTPEVAKEYYGKMVAFSKIGGILSAALAWILFCHKQHGCNVHSDVYSHQLVLGVSALCLAIVPFIVFYLMRHIPEKFLHGYEAVYQFEKKAVSSQDKSGLLQGLKLLLHYPYVMGIFGMVFFYEVVITILSYLRLIMAYSSSENISAMSGELFKIAFLTHIVGFLLSYFGTSNLLRALGERVCLLLIPTISGILLIIFTISSHHHYALIAAYVVLKAVNQAFSWPVRESLYIPTVKEIRFKAKSWIDAFGGKLAKTTGGTLNYWVHSCATHYFLLCHTGIFGVIVIGWFLTAYFLGKRFDRAVKCNEAIGS